MIMNRRNVLVLLAAVAIGGGLIAGTGAFSQVEASRTADVGVSGDSSALLKIEDNTSSSSFVSATTTDGDNVDTIEFQETNLNDDATTRYNYSLDVTNNGNSTVNFYVEDSTGVVDLVNASDDSTVVGSSVSLDEDDTVKLHIVITTTDSGDTFPDEITFVAESA